MSPKRALSFVCADDRLLMCSRRDRQTTRRSMYAGGTVCEREAWRHCGKGRRSTERPMSTLRHAAVLRLALVDKVSGCARNKPMIAWRQNAGTSAGGQGRKPAEPGARSASLDRLTPGRHRSPKRSWIARVQEGRLSSARSRGCRSDH
jgi:hypothetical protein